jgi:hypothetical protein
MKFDTNIWQGRRDLSSKPTSYLVGVLSKSAAYAAMLGLVAGACFACAWRGGTEHTHSWQFIVFGSMVMFYIAVCIIGDRQLSAMIQKRTENSGEGVPNQSIQSIGSHTPNSDA